jgi:hypothetical protein
VATLGNDSLRSHLSDFETTTSDLLRPEEARAMLNFAALFHETLYLTDTAIGDHELIIKSFKEGHHGLFFQIRRLGEEGILRVLYRDKVVVRGKELESGKLIPIRKIFEGWRHRDKVEWGGDTGFTTVVPDNERFAYYREVEEWLSRYDIVTPYNPDLPKNAFREAIRGQLGTSPSTLLQTVTGLPSEIQDKYFKATEDPWFTNAELWRHLREVKELPPAREAIILQAHINQQCYADLTNAGQATHDRGAQSLASYNLELKRHRPLGMEAESTITPPENLADLLKDAPVQLYSPGLQMFEELSPEEIVTIRRHARPLFELAHRAVATEEDLKKLHQGYLKELGKYWNFIVDRFEDKHRDKMLHRTPVGLFVEKELGTLGPLYDKYGTDVLPLVLRFVLHVASPLVGPALKGLNRIGYIFLYGRTPGNERLRSQLPPLEWRTPPVGASRGLLILDGTSGKAA